MCTYISTPDIAEACRAAQLIVSGAGSPGLLTGDMVTEGVIVIVPVPRGVFEGINAATWVAEV